MNLSCDIWLLSSFLPQRVVRPCSVSWTVTWMCLSVCIGVRYSKPPLGGVQWVILLAGMRKRGYLAGMVHMYNPDFIDNQDFFLRIRVNDPQGGKSTLCGTSRKTLHYSKDIDRVTCEVCQLLYFSIKY